MRSKVGRKEGDDAPILYSMNEWKEGKKGRRESSSDVHKNPAEELHRQSQLRICILLLPCMMRSFESYPR